MKLRSTILFGLMACGSVSPAAPDAAGGDDVVDAAEVPDAATPDGAPGCVAGHDMLFATGFGGGGVEIFDCLGGTVAKRLIAGASTGLGFGWYSGLAYDPASDTLYVAEHADGTVRIWADASSVTGDVAPTRVLQTGSAYQDGLALDRVHDRLYVYDENDQLVRVYANASTVTGAAVPTATISTPFAREPAFDEPNDRLYMAMGDHVDVYDQASAITGTGGSASRTFTIAGETALNAVWLDADDNRAYVSANSGAGKVYVIDRAAQAVGTVTPTRTLLGGVFNIVGVQVTDDRLFAITDSASSVLEFDPASTVDGDTPPSHTYALDASAGSGDAFLYVP